ncbi:hypothetical protein LZ31DRAFT_628980 [Colletotrichum somersetense]|nr:hypothetical protein LZ31DRAFT_628980 [Colletotrichum somersetense]
MALEDAASLALVVKRVGESQGRIVRGEGLGFWQKIRRERLGELVVLTKMLNNKRLPSDKLAELPREEVWYEEGEGQMNWLYMPKIEDQIEEWLTTLHHLSESAYRHEKADEMVTAWGHPYRPCNWRSIYLGKLCDWPI